MNLKVEIRARGSAVGLKRFRSGIGDTKGLTEVHTRIARAVKTLVVDYVASDDSHTTAEKLGAKPTGHMAKNAKRIEAQGETYQAILRIPRKSRLRAAFGAFTLTAGAGKTYLTIPAHQSTYGRSARTFAEGELKFAVIKSWRIFLALVFAEGRYKGEVAYWLRRSVEVKEDRTLMPFDEIPVAAARVASDYIGELARGGAS